MAARKGSGEKLNVHDIITQRFLAALSEGIVPWRQPWACPGGGGSKNLFSQKDYKGVNILLLATQGYTQPYWLTINQAKKAKLRIRYEEMTKGTPIVFWKVGERTDKKTGDKEKSFVLRYYKVWNVTQLEADANWQKYAPAPKESGKVFSPIQECDNLVKLYKTIPRIEHGGGRAFYNPSFDYIGMPPRESFNSPEEYYSTFFHELVHSTGHKDRLDREGITNPIKFGSHDYSFEELVAECGSAFLCGRAGIINRTIDNSTAYIQNWASKLKSEPRWIVEAASKADKAVTYIAPREDAADNEDEEESEEVAA